MEEEAAAQGEAQVEDQVEAQVEAQAEMMAEAMVEATAEDHQENLLEISQEEMNQGETTLGTPHNEDPDNNLEDDKNRSNSPPPRRTAAPSGYNRDQLNSTVWRANSSRANTPGEGMSEERNNAFHECLHEAIQDTARDVLRWMPVTAGTYAYLKTVAAGTHCQSNMGKMTYKSSCPGYIALCTTLTSIK